MQIEIPILFNTYKLTNTPSGPSVRCNGCQELQHPGLDAPAHMVGLIEFAGGLIPVIDPSSLFGAESTPLNSSTCILVVEHLSPGRVLHTGIIVPDSQEILELASGTFSAGPLPQSSVNITFVLAIPDNMHAAMFLAANHRIMASSIRPSVRTSRSLFPVSLREKNPLTV